jgi:hypothetical protein
MSETAAEHSHSKLRGIHSKIEIKRERARHNGPDR